MKILAFMQNQWFKDPEKVRAIYAKHPEMRNDLIARFLFMGCLSGRRLRAALGEQLCDQIVWEEASPEIGGNAASKFPADTNHIAGAIIKHKPDVVFAFGAIASNGVLAAWPEIAAHPTPIVFELITGPHPAARKDPMPRLREMAQCVQ